MQGHLKSTSVEHTTQASAAQSVTHHSQFSNATAARVGVLGQLMQFSDTNAAQRSRCEHIFPTLRSSKTQRVRFKQYTHLSVTKLVCSESDIFSDSSAV